MNTFNIFQGDKVTGRYYGQDFAGTVAVAYPFSTSPLMVLSVKLDKPIVIDGEERKAVCVYVKQDGTSRNGEESITAHRRPVRPNVYRYANIPAEKRGEMYHQHRMLWYSVSSGYWVMHEDGEYTELPEDATKWPPTIELTPVEMKHYLDELTG